VRFGKYTGSGVQNRAVKITVNGVWCFACFLVLERAWCMPRCDAPLTDIQYVLQPTDVEAGFTMHLGRTGEAFFLGEEVEDGSGENGAPNVPDLQCATCQPMRAHLLTRHVLCNAQGTLSLPRNSSAA
jgi:hypothetical protein